MTNLQTQISELKHLIQQSTTTTVLTGAGISVASGIPDWEMMNHSFDFVSQESLQRDPEAYFAEFHRLFIDPIVTNGPSVAHQVLATLQQRNLIGGIVTTNIDFLHQFAGSPLVANIWSSININHCLDCGRIFDFKILQASVPHCPVCGGLISPDPVFRHIATLPDAQTQADNWMAASDLTIVIGSNGYYSKTSNSNVVNINPKPNVFDKQSTLKITASADAAFTELANQLAL